MQIEKDRQNMGTRIATIDKDEEWVTIENSLVTLLNAIDHDDEKDFDGFQQKKSTLDLSAWKRCRVLSIVNDLPSRQVILKLREDCNDKKVAAEAVCRLLDPWNNTTISSDEIVSIRAVWNEEFQSFCVTAEAGFIVTQPDHLINAKCVVSADFCLRKTILSEKFTGIDDRFKTVSQLVHELFKRVLNLGLQTIEAIQSECDRMLQRQSTLSQLYALDITISEARNEMQTYMTSMAEFMAGYMAEDVIMTNDGFEYKIDSIGDIEDSVWVPQLGLKGRVDATVKIRGVNSTFYRAHSNNVKTMPMDIRIGRESYNNKKVPRMTMTIYNMLMDEVYESSVGVGILVYLMGKNITEVKNNRRDERALIMLRNKLAYYLRANEKYEIYNENDGKLNKIDTPLLLPDPIQHSSACSKCVFNTVCCAYLSRNEKQQLSSSHPLQAVMKHQLERFSHNHIDYFIYWTGLVHLDAFRPSRKGNQMSNLWTKSAESRQEQKHAICNLVINGPVVFKKQKYLHEFVVNCSADETQDVVLDLTLSGMQTGDYLYLSTRKRVAVYGGRAVTIKNDSITMELDRNLTKQFAHETFILDRSASSSLSGLYLTALALLMDDRNSSAKLRSTIIDRMKPTFSDNGLDIFSNHETIQIMAGLNISQQNAVIKAVTVNDYLLVKGLPGTGKTETLVAIVMVYSLMGKSVLIVSHSHCAVDNVMVKLLDKGLEFMRLHPPATANIVPEVRKFTEMALTENCKTTDDFRQVYNKYDIFGATCIGSIGNIFLHRRFDICLVDEAAQILQPEVIRPLLLAEKFVLFGDPNQIRPLVKTKEAKLLGLGDETLFHRLDSDEATIVLPIQYRMNEVIAKLANDLMYGGSLQCATDEVALATMAVPGNEIVTQRCDAEKWLEKPLSNELSLSVVLVDTGNVFCRSIEFGASLKQNVSQIMEQNFEHHSFSVEEIDKRAMILANYCEAAVCLQLVQALIQIGVSGKTIGIISPHRSHVELLKLVLNKYDANNNVDTINIGCGIEVNIAEKFQGRHKEVIIYSCSKCDNPAKETQLPDEDIIAILSDKRQVINALNRCKQKLIVVGDVESMQMYPPYDGLFQNIIESCKVPLSDVGMGLEWKVLLHNLLLILEQ